MSWLVSRLPRWVPIPGKRLMGKDLEGNRYFEAPNATGARPKRTVEYKIMDNIPDYTSGRHTLPIQWKAWLAHTRPTPPPLTELLADRTRLARLGPLVAAIEARERAERIRQGYLVPDADPASHQRPSIAGPGPRGQQTQDGWGSGEERYSGLPSSARRVMTGPGLMRGSGAAAEEGSSGAAGGMEKADGQPPQQQEYARRPIPLDTETSGSPSSSRAAPDLAGPAGPRAPGPTQSLSSSSSTPTPFPPAPRMSYPSAPGYHSATPSSSSPTPNPTASTTTTSPIPTPPSPHVAPPAETVDPAAYDDPAALRRLAEEDTRRRIAASGATEGSGTVGPGGAIKGSGTVGPGGGGAVESGTGQGGLRPRRRGGA